MPKKTFYIIDGHAQIYRAYFAPFRELTSPSGEPTKATFVFTQALLNLVALRKPDYLAMAIDSGEEKVFRREIYPAYKANRAARPADLTPQEQRILRIVRDAGVKIFVKPGFEADDLIATMARRLETGDFDVVLVSKDKDLRQILRPGVRMYDLQADTFLDADAMQKKYGYTPKQAVEVQTLVGDATDNVPGIGGVGPKTAAKLIAQYGSADAVLKHLEELTPKLRENFQAGAANLPLTRKLVTLVDDVDFPFDPEACRFSGFNISAIKAHLQELGFTALIKRLEGAPAAPAAPAATAAPKAQAIEGGLFDDVSPIPATTLESSTDCDYQLVNTPEKFSQFLKKLATQKRFAFDTETDALGAMKSRPVGLSISWAPQSGFYIPVQVPDGAVLLPAKEVFAALKPILEDPAYKKVGQNIKYDMLVLRNQGIELRGVELDSMIAASLIDVSRNTYSMDALAATMLNVQTIPISQLIGRGKKQISMAQVPLAAITRYAAEDADITLRLADLLEKKLDEFPAIRKLCSDVETPLIDVLAEMEFNGIAVDRGILQEQSRLMAGRIDDLRQRVYTAAGKEFNLSSPRQLADVLFNKLGLRVIKRNETGPSTDVEVLEALADESEVCRLMLEYRMLEKLKNTYLDNLPEHINPRTGRIHPNFSQIGAQTGRLSCNDPNLQNIPIRSDEGRSIRLAFVPGDAGKNVLLTADYSQIELRMLAHFTQEPGLVRAFAADEDIHKAVAAEVYNVSVENVTRQQRSEAKTINFGIIYGVSAWGLAKRIEGLNLEGAEKLIAAYHRRFPGIQKFMDQSIAQAQTQGYVETILGRRRPILDINSGVVRISNAAQRAAANTVIQGSAADLIKVAMLRVHRRLKAEKRPSRMLLQLHDELVFETPLDAVKEDSALIEQEMTHAMDLRVPLKVDIGYGKNWQDGKG